MTNIKISTQRQEALCNMWEKFKASYSETVRQNEIKETNLVLDQWDEYKQIIVAKALTLQQYTNRKGNDEVTLAGDYLCNFLERTSKTKFGSSRPGNANNFEVKLNEDGYSYSLRSELKGASYSNNSFEEANKFFLAHIKPLLESIVGCKDPEKIATLVEHDNFYAAKQVLRKMAVLENRYQFLFIYSNDTIDTLHNELVDDEASSNLAKNYQVRRALNEILSVQDTIMENVLLSRFIWKYANTKGLADTDTPNVILYGPPGTGKTYAVKNSLDFLCQGDRSRYEFLQFHPSFTYEDFIEGIKPKGVTKDGNIKFELVDGIFKRFCKKAKANPSQDYYFVVDEINRANLSSVFGETLLCLEKDYRHDLRNGVANDNNLIKTQYSTLIEEMIKDGADESLAYHYQDGSAYFGVPHNVFFIGMMNDVDKSIDAFDLALRRRFKWIRKDCDYDVIENEVKFRSGADFNNIDRYQVACRTLNDFISDDLRMGKSFEFGHSFFMKISAIASTRNITEKNAKTLFTLHLEPTLKEYLRAMFPESELDNKVQEACMRFSDPLKI